MFRTRYGALGAKDSDMLQQCVEGTSHDVKKGAGGHSQTECKVGVEKALCKLWGWPCSWGFKVPSERERDRLR